MIAIFLTLCYGYLFTSLGFCTKQKIILQGGIIENFEIIENFHRTLRVTESLPNINKYACNEIFRLTPIHIGRVYTRVWIKVIRRSVNNVLPGRERNTVRAKEVPFAFMIHKGVETQDLEAYQNIIGTSRTKMREWNTRLVGMQPAKVKELTRFTIHDKRNNRVGPYSG